MSVGQIPQDTESHFTRCGHICARFQNRTSPLVNHGAKRPSLVATPSATWRGGYVVHISPLTNARAPCMRRGPTRHILGASWRHAFLLAWETSPPYFSRLTQTRGLGHVALSMATSQE